MICNEIDNKVYIGSTRTILRLRWYTHKREALKLKKNKKYQSILEI